MTTSREARRSAGAASPGAGLNQASLRSLLGISRILASYLHPRELLARLAAETAGMLEVEGVLVLLRDSEGRAMQVMAHHGFPAGFGERVFPGVKRAYRELPDLGKPFGWPVFAGSPLMVDGRLRGLLCIYSAADIGGRKRENLLNLLSDLAASALKNALLYQQAHHGRETFAETLAVVFRHVQEGLVFLDTDRRVALANPAALRMLGLDETPLGVTFEELAGSCRLSFPSTPAAGFLDLFLPRQGLAGLSVHAGRTDRHIQLGAYGVVSDGGRSIGTVILFHDVTEEKKATRMREDFLSTATHDLRTPLTVISSYLQLLRQPNYAAGPGRVAQAYEVIERNVVRMNQICNELLELSRLVTGRFPMNPVRTDLAEVARDAMEEVGVLFEEKGVRLEMELSRAPLVADPLRLAQVLVNLSGNALKFTRRGGKVALRTWTEAAAACLDVADEGPGIPQGKLADVFRPFYQVDGVGESGGFGLGLAIAKGIVEAHGGSITVWSRPGEGSVFTVRLPVPASAPS